MIDPRFTIRDWLWTVALIALTTLVLVQQAKIENAKVQAEFLFRVLQSHESRLNGIKYGYNGGCSCCPCNGE